jgi:hypothetical protein
MKPTDPLPSGRPAPKAKYDDGVVHYPHDDGHGHDDTHNEAVAHEHQDVDLRAIVTSAVVLVVVTLAAQAGMWVLFNRFESEAQARQPQVSPLTKPATDMPKTTAGSPYFSQGVPTTPLMWNEPMALGQARAEQLKRLDSYGWVDQNAGVAHLPIAEAKKLLLSKGAVPVREGASAATFTVRPWARGESSGGRTVTVDLPDSPAAPGAPPAQEHGAPAAEKPPAKPGGH